MTQFYRAAVGAFVVNEKEQILITHKYSHSGNWNFPKGGIEEGESEEETLKRELSEELGVENIKILAKSKISNIYRLADDYIEKYNIDHIGQAQRYYWVFLRSDTKLLIPNKEVEKYKWIEINPQEIAKWFKRHDSEKVFQTLIPLEFEEVRLML